jgi:hypothetical protein
LELSASSSSGFLQGNECVLRFVLDRGMALCLDLVLEGGSGAQYADLLSDAKNDPVA